MFVCALLVLGGYLFFVNTRWGQMVDDAAYSGRNIIWPALIEYDHVLLNAVSVRTLVVAIILILVVGALRHCLTAAAMIADGFACTVVGGELLKHGLPWHVLVFNDIQLPLDLQRHTYPSGHTTIGTSLAIAVVLVSPTRWRLLMAVVAGLLSASFATGVLFVGWHRPSDALGGIFWSGFGMSLAALLAIAFSGKPIRGGQAAAAPLSSILVLIVAAIAISFCFITGNLAHSQIAPQVSFLILTLLIMISSFGVALWIGWLLRYVDWVEYT
jgi:PAP2 superfamily